MLTACGERADQGREAGEGRGAGKMRQVEDKQGKEEERSGEGQAGWGLGAQETPKKQQTVRGSRQRPTREVKSGEAGRGGGK